MSDMISLQTIKDQKFENSRSDNWWLLPVLQFSALIVFIIYSMWAVLLDVDNVKVTDTHYVSPYFSPEIHLSWWPAGWSPGLMLIWAPLGFRATCYYARKVYYRAFFADPPACAVGEMRIIHDKFKGETKFPLIMNNFHRYFFYMAFILAVIHLINFFRTFSFGPEGATEFGIGIGGLLLGLDATFLLLYVLSCHSCKHLIGGGLDCYSCKTAGIARYKSWSIVKKLNENHGTYFWLSLLTILLSDVYIRLYSRGIIDAAFDRIL